MDLMPFLHVNQSQKR